MLNQRIDSAESKKMEKNMFKKIILSAAFCAAMALSASSAYSFCGGNVVPDNDCDSNPRNFSTSCCPSGYRVQGVAYSDMSNSDYADAVSAVCRHIQKGNDMMPTDFQRSPVVFMCEKQEVLAGIACKDMDKKSGKNSDNLDGCTAICQRPGDSNLRMVYNNDIAGNSRSFVQHTVSLPERVVGIAYKDVNKERDANDYDNSDRADCATISHKYQPIVQ